MGYLFGKQIYSTQFNLLKFLPGLVNLERVGVSSLYLCFMPIKTKQKTWQPISGPNDKPFTQLANLKLFLIGA
jgi:hypothetical protein